MRESTATVEVAKALVFLLGKGHAQACTRDALVAALISRYEPDRLHVKRSAWDRRCRLAKAYAIRALKVPIVSTGQGFYVAQTAGEREAGAAEYRKLARMNSIMAASIMQIPLAQELRQAHLAEADRHFLDEPGQEPEYELHIGGDRCAL